MLYKKCAVVDRKHCVACGACENTCPKTVIKVCNGCYAFVSGEQCVGCGKCAKICPSCCIEVRERDRI